MVRFTYLLIHRYTHKPYTHLFTYEIKYTGLDYGINLNKIIRKKIVSNEENIKEALLSSDIRKRNCYFCKNDIDKIDYKDKDLLVKFTTPSGRILSSRITRICPKHQRKIQRAVKRAREIALIPFVETSYM